MIERLLVLFCTRDSGLLLACTSLRRRHQRQAVFVYVHTRLLRLLAMRVPVRNQT